MPLPAGPRTPALWQTVRFVRDPDGYARHLRSTYGDLVPFNALLGKGVAIFESELAREIFAAPPDTFQVMPLISAIFGSTAVIAVGGAQHRKLRKLLNPRFHGAQVKGFLAAMQRAIRVHLDRLGDTASHRDTLAMSDVAQALALDVIIETVFGAGDLDRERARAVLLGMVQAFSPAILGGTTFHKPWFPPWRRYVRAREIFDRWVVEVVAQRRTRGAEQTGDDVLGVLLAARYEDGAPMDDAEISDQLFTLLLAGHETSAIAMTWSVYHLLRAPDVLAHLRKELEALGPNPSPESITRLPYLGAVVSETLRIEPIVTDVIRVLREPFTLGDRWTLPAGHTIVVMLISILRDPRVFPEPERFRPERFLEKKFGPAEFLPFGGGARRCLGAAFAEAELALAVAEIASRWDVELADSKPEPSVRRNLTMGPKNGVRVRVRGRRATSR